MSTNDLKIVFFGTPEFTTPVLTLLIENGYKVSAVFTGKGPIEQVAKKHNIKVFQPVSLKKDDQVFEEFKNMKPDICIVVAYGKIFPQKFLDVPRYGFINIHPSLLPKYRGPSPIQTALLNGDKETGVTIMLVDDEVDHGSILAKEKYMIDEEKDLSEISNDLFGLGAKLLLQTIPSYINNGIEPKEQDHSLASFTKKFSREDGRINWFEPEDKIYNQTRALNPEPGTWTIWPARRSLDEGSKGKVINISKCTTRRVVHLRMTDLAPEMPGTVRKIGGDIVIVTGTGYLIVKSLQLEGRKIMDAKNFVNGHPDFLNSKLE